MAFNRVIPRVKYPESYRCNPGHVAPSPSALSSLLTDVDKDENMEDCYTLRTDNYLILHQKDLENRLGIDNVRAWIQAMNQASGSAMSDQYQKALDALSDRELFSMLRSRHIQSPAEIAAYNDAILSEAQELYERRVSLAEENAAIAAQGVFEL